MFEAETILKNSNGGNVSYLTNVEKVQLNNSEIRKKRKHTKLAMVMRKLSLPQQKLPSFEPKVH